MSFSVQTRYPVALESVDHLYPRGTKNDNSTNSEFIWKAARQVQGGFGEKLSLLDVGCSGGGLVQAILRCGCEAVGIEGSDYSQRTGRAAWVVSECKGHLFTADIGKPFLVLDQGRLAPFNVVTAWEVLEHLSEEELETLNLTLHAHMREHGLFMGSVNTESDFFEGVEYHKTLRPAQWWEDFFQARGWIWDARIWHSMNPDWVRGPNTDGPASKPFVFRKR